MSKKLVKTAKQQFEDRLQQLNVVNTWKMCETEIYHLCLDDKAHVHLLREQDGEYKELSYGMQYEDLTFSERFLSMMSERFAENEIKIKPLFDWYASADHDDEPFNLLDIYMCELEESHFTFEDLYEEVPDEPRIITAREQFLNELRKLGIKAGQVGNEDEWYEAEEDGKLVIMEYFRDEDSYKKYTFDLPKASLFASPDFQVKMMNRIRETNYDAVIDMVEWMKDTTTEPPFGLDDIIYTMEFEEWTYEDKPTPEVTPNYFDKEIDELRQKMIAHIAELCEAGKTLNVEVFCQNPFLLYVAVCYASTEEIVDCWLWKNMMNEWRFCWQKSGESSYEDSLDSFRIDTLKDIIEAMQ